MKYKYIRKMTSKKEERQVKEERGERRARGREVGGERESLCVSDICKSH